MRWLLGLTLVVALAAGGCDSDDRGGDSDNAGVGGSPRATVPRAVTTTTSADPFAVPAAIDEAYVQRVVQKLYEIEDEALRLMIRDNRVGPEVGRILEAMFLPSELDAQIQGWVDVVESGDLANFRNDPGSVLIVELDVLEAASDCIASRVLEDSSASLKSPVPPSEVLLVLRPKSAPQDPEHRNPTPWMVARESTSREDARCAQ